MPVTLDLKCRFGGVPRREVPRGTVTLRKPGTVQGPSLQSRSSPPGNRRQARRSRENVKRTWKSMDQAASVRGRCQDQPTVSDRFIAGDLGGALKPASRIYADAQSDSSG